MSDLDTNITQSDDKAYDSAEFAKDARQVSVEIKNRVDIEGYIDSDVVLDHVSHNEGIYAFTLKVPRLRKDVYDYIQVGLPEKLLEGNEYVKGDKVSIVGQFRSYNVKSEDNPNHMRLILYIFVEDICKIEKVEKVNVIRLHGHLCKNPNYRKTSTGREICDMLLAVNRNYSRCDYIPCITWGRDAKYSSKFVIGSNIYITGRVQSRKYKKYNDDGTFRENEVYEVSVSDVQELDEEAKVVMQIDMSNISNNV